VVELSDDLGTEYLSSSGGGSGHLYYLSFTTAPPAETSWLEVVVDGKGPSRLSL